jgi:hypothetical protein
MDGIIRRESIGHPRRFGVASGARGAPTQDRDHMARSIDLTLILFAAKDPEQREQALEHVVEAQVDAQRC